MSGQKNRGAREDSLWILGSVEPLSKKPPLQNQGFKWWEYVTELLQRSPFITVSRRDKLVTWLRERIRMLCESKMDTERVFQIVKTAKEYQRRK